jgi:hypothetical protein
MNKIKSLTKNPVQLDLFKGRELRDAGIKRALDRANSKTEIWSELAYLFLLQNIKTGDRFMVEEIRVKGIGIVPEPPSNRAWGGIILRAIKEGVIVNDGYGKVKNPSAHCTPAAIWRVI